MEGEGSSEMEYTEIEASADYFDSSILFNIINDVSAFVLFMHQQLPSILQDMSIEFDTLHEEYKELGSELAQNELKASSRRKHTGRMREVRQGIKRMEKLMNSVSGFQSAIKLLITEIPNIEEVLLILGATPLRPQHVYQLCFLQRKAAVGGADDFIKHKAAEVLSRKAIRTLISKDAGSSSYPGPTKLFLLVKAPASFNLPLHFIPKRDFRYSKKIVPFKLRFKCKGQIQKMNAPDRESQVGNCDDLTNSSVEDSIWFQCRHAIKGLAFNRPDED
ncbi:uncharacterized protein LOC111018414 [Momordica charantia]|uniref:Uncharacterized protein LOC111018414 n=1 Tax=Momordica charantia TaxID=3673 RepID=A0A6J1D966_MOMCH|nr:uncharacterized protein LOC111018414 [Momordica charantia]XP_022150170.1 uncharacterized protein LOC111018414 [Momordica charantia]